MGCCISKCRPQKHFIDEFSHVQEKLVISQPPRLTTPPISSSNKISPCPQSPSHSTSSASSFTCTTTTTSTSSASSLTSALSTASSLSASKIDRSFSNEFLWSCYKENPHVIRINSIKDVAFPKFSPPTPRQKPVLAPAVNKKPPAPKRVYGSVTPQKRVRSSSPTALTRQKSFRKEPEKQHLVSAYDQNPNRGLRSPSPSRRFNLSNPPKPLPTHHNAFNIRPQFPNQSNISSRSIRPCLKNRAETETRIHRISSKIDEVAVREALADYMESLPEEDIDNPLISLDCFIFL